MASSLAEKIDQNFLQCGICLESFQKPRGLPCLHSFCEECLERWANKEKKSRVLICPNCKRPTQIPTEGIKGFPAHFLVNSLQETVNMEKAKEDFTVKVCSKCNKADIKANVYCCNCKHFLCKSCFDSHKSWESMKNHRVITIDDLSSGKVALSKSDTQDQYCTEHDDELKKFYCETCGKPVCRDCIVMKQCCRDHDYITLKEASNKNSSQLKEEIKKCSEKRKQCQEAAKNAERIKSQLSKSVEDAQTTLKNVKKDYMQQLAKVFSQQESNINKQAEDQSEKLDQITKSITADLNKLDIATMTGNNLIETGSHYDITSGYETALVTLKDANRVRLKKADGCLAVISIPVLSTCVVGNLWKQSGQFDVHSQCSPIGIAVTSDNKIAVANSVRVNVFSRSGNKEHCFSHVPYNGEDVVVTQNNNIAFLSYSQFCFVYNSMGKIINEFPLNYPITHAVLTADTNENIIVGLKTGIVYIHHVNDWSVKSSFNLHSVPNSIAIPAVAEIVVVTKKGTLETVGYSGKGIHVFQPPPEVITWKPSCVCCSKKYEVFVVNEGDPKAIYRYTAGGEYMGCVTTEIHDVRGIAMSPDNQELFVTEYSDKLVKIFKRP